MPFEARLAKSNEPPVKSLAQMIVTVVAPYDFGTFITYADLKKIIFENPQGPRGRNAIVQAKRRLLHEHNKLLVNERDKGYRIVLPADHLRESKRLDARAEGRRRRALDVLLHAEEAKLTAEERRQNQEQARRYQLLLAMRRNIAKATLQGTGASAAIVIPSGRQLAKLLQQSSDEVE